MATIKAILKKKNSSEYQTNKLGEALVYIQYGHSGKKTLFSSGVKINPDFWNGDNDQNKLIKSGLKGYTTKTSLINKLKFQIDEVVTRLFHNDIEPTIDRVKYEIDGDSQTKEFKQKDIVQLFDDFIQNARQEKKSPNTIKGYVTVFGHLKSFSKTRKESITFDKIDLKLIDDIRRFLISDQNLINNTVEGSIKIIKAFVTKLIDNGHETKIDPKKIKINWGAPQIIFLTKSELDQLYEHQFDKSNLEKVRDLFVLACCTAFRYSDLTRLAQHHINGNVIQMKAYKNTKDTFVPIIPRARAILEKYEHNLPRYSEPVYNRYIKEACKLAGLTATIELFEMRGGEKIINTFEKWQKISSHIAVSTYITHALQNGVPGKHVSVITGKTMKVINKHYAGVDEDDIIEKVMKAFS